MFCKIEGVDIPLVSTGTSPFLGAGQFGNNAQIYLKKFMNNVSAVLEILEECYKAGGRGIELIPAGKIGEAARVMKEIHNDFVITGSTYPGPDPLLEKLIELDTKIIFIHGMVSDEKDEKLIRLVDEVSSRGVIPGIAAHNPVSTLEFAFKNLPDVKAFLIPFNANGMFMGDKKKLEVIVNNNKNYSFIGMKTLAAGKLNPKEAYEYISEHNICAVTIGMVKKEEAKISTKIALEAFCK